MLTPDAYDLVPVASLEADRPLVDGLLQVALPLIEDLDPDAVLAKVDGGVASAIQVVAVAAIYFEDAAVPVCADPARSWF